MKILNEVGMNVIEAWGHSIENDPDLSDSEFEQYCLDIMEWVDYLDPIERPWMRRWTGAVINSLMTLRNEKEVSKNTVQKKRLIEDKGSEWVGAMSLFEWYSAAKDELDLRQLWIRASQWFDVRDGIMTAGQPAWSLQEDQFKSHHDKSWFETVTLSANRKEVNPLIYAETLEEAMWTWILQRDYLEHVFQGHLAAKEVLRQRWFEHASQYVQYIQQQEDQDMMKGSMSKGWWLSIMFKALLHEAKFPMEKGLWIRLNWELYAHSGLNRSIKAWHSELFVNQDWIALWIEDRKEQTQWLQKHAPALKTVIQSQENAAQEWKKVWNEFLGLPPEKPVLQDGMSMRQELAALFNRSDSPDSSERRSSQNLDLEDDD